MKNRQSTLPSPLVIFQDSDPETPRNFGHIGTMACWHRRYRLGDQQVVGDPAEWLIKNVPKGSVTFPLYLYDHSGITMNTTGFSCGWDSGVVGRIYVTPDKIRQEYGVKRISQKLRDQVEERLRTEVGLYDLYLRGQVWGYEFSPDGWIEDSGYGYCGETLRETGLEHNVPAAAMPFLDEAWERRYYKTLPAPK